MPCEQNLRNGGVPLRMFGALLVMSFAGCHYTDSSASPALCAYSPQVDARFRYDGDFIHPACVWHMLTDVADVLPCVAAVDVAGCQESNRFSIRRTQDGWLKWKDESGRVHDGWVTWKDESRFGTGSFEYKHLGVLPNGIHVLLTQWSGGGSGIFRDLLFVRAKDSRVYEEGSARNRTLLVCVGQCGLGDRDEGTVRLVGNSVILGKSQYRERDVALDLTAF